jgi:hypothetical protein
VLSAKASDFSLEITSDSPIAIGTFVTFNVTLKENGKIAPNSKYEFSYELIGTSQSHAVETSSPSFQFQISATTLDHGIYEVHFIAKEYFIFMFVEKAEARSSFAVTNRFKGSMDLIQGPNNTIRDNGYVSSQTETLHNIIIAEKDMKLYEKAAYIRVFWFVNCLYMGEY